MFGSQFVNFRPDIIVEFGPCQCYWIPRWSRGSNHTGRIQMSHTGPKSNTMVLPNARYYYYYHNLGFETRTYNILIMTQQDPRCDILYLSDHPIIRTDSISVYISGGFVWFHRSLQWVLLYAYRSFWIQFIEYKISFHLLCLIPYNYI